MSSAAIAAAARESVGTNYAVPSESKCACRGGVAMALAETERVVRRRVASGKERIPDAWTVRKYCCRRRIGEGVDDVKDHQWHRGARRSRTSDASETSEPCPSGDLPRRRDCSLSRTFVVVRTKGRLSMGSEGYPTFPNRTSSNDVWVCSIVVDENSPPPPRSTIPTFRDRYKTSE